MLLPSMTIWAAEPVHTSIPIVGNKEIRLPVRTEIAGVGGGRGEKLSAEVLPVVRVDTQRLIMFMIERTPFGLEAMHIKLSILSILVEKFNLQFSLSMGKAAVLAILAIPYLPWIALTHSLLIFLRMIHQLSHVVTHGALVTQVTLAHELLVGTAFGGVKNRHTSSIMCAVEVGAMFRIM